MRIKKNMKISSQIKLVAEKKNREEISYYLTIGKQQRRYAFTRPFTKGTWNLCKNGIGIDELLTLRSDDKAVMKLVAYSRYIIPFLCEEYELPFMTSYVHSHAYSR